MLNLKELFQDEKLIKQLLKRNLDKNFIEECKNKYVLRKELLTQLEELQSEFNKKNKEILSLKDNVIKFQQEQEKLKEDKTILETMKEKYEAIHKEFYALVETLPNIPDEIVPEGKDETFNKEIFLKGEKTEFHFKPKNHYDLGVNLNYLDFERSSKVSGSRFSFLYNDLARLERALSNFMIDTHCQRGFEEVSPPLLVRSETLFGTGQLPKFHEELFKIDHHDLFLIPTAEVSLTNIFSQEKIQETKRFVAHTPCFRSEAGSYGKDTKGLIRQHQFYKVEMVILALPEESENEFHFMLESACLILDLLELPYRGIQLCAGDLGFSAKKTVDLEVYLPSEDHYREISSVSHCGDFQARRMNTKTFKGDYIHTLNGSGLAVGRTLVAILENFQLEDGSIFIPKILRKYMNNDKKLIAK